MYFHCLIYNARLYMLYSYRWLMLRFRHIQLCIYMPKRMFDLCCWLLHFQRNGCNCSQMCRRCCCDRFPLGNLFPQKLRLYNIFQQGRLCVPIHCYACRYCIAEPSHPGNNIRQDIRPPFCTTCGWCRYCSMYRCTWCTDSSPLLRCCSIYRHRKSCHICLM